MMPAKTTKRAPRIVRRPGALRGAFDLLKGERLDVSASPEDRIVEPLLAVGVDLLGVRDIFRSTLDCESVLYARILRRNQTIRDSTLYFPPSLFPAKCALFLDTVLLLFLR